MAIPGAPVFVSSWNGVPAIDAAARALAGGAPLLDAIVAGISLVEDDPAEMSVGLGGLPNEDGEVELDAAVMDGQYLRAGAVAGLRRVRHAARLALEVMRRTDHCLLVGEGALAFARKLGYPEGDLLTPESRGAWLAWKASLSDKDAWVSPDEGASEFGTARWAGRADPAPGAAPDVPFTFGTIHVSGRHADGTLGAATSTSGLSYKIAGRVGDSPIVGAGLYCENGVGSAGATGRGESTLQVCAAHRVVEAMRSGMDPTPACLATIGVIVDATRLARLRDGHGRPRFNVTLYALRADGAIGAASIHAGYEFAAHEAGATLRRAAASFYPPDSHPDSG